MRTVLIFRGTWEFADLVVQTAVEIQSLHAWESNRYDRYN
jgi:hypothetical protein